MDVIVAGDRAFAQLLSLLAFVLDMHRMAIGTYLEVAMHIATENDIPAGRWLSEALKYFGLSEDVSKTLQRACLLVMKGPVSGRNEYAGLISIVYTRKDLPQQNLHLAFNNGWYVEWLNPARTPDGLYHVNLVFNDDTPPVPSYMKLL